MNLVLGVGILFSLVGVIFVGYPLVCWLRGTPFLLTNDDTNHTYRASTGELALYLMTTIPGLLAGLLTIVYWRNWSLAIDAQELRVTNMWRKPGFHCKLDEITSVKLTREGNLDMVQIEIPGKRVTYFHTTAKIRELVGELREHAPEARFSLP